MAPKIAINKTTFGLPPICLDSKVYIVMSGTYSRVWEEKQITEGYTDDGSIDRQTFNTKKHRWTMTLVVPVLAADVAVTDGALDGIPGTLDDLHATAAKEAPLDLLTFHDITANWNFTSSPTYSVYLAMTSESPFNDDIGSWQVPIALWGNSYGA